MEPYSGVFVSNVRTKEWEPDPEVPGSEMHELVHADGVWAGLTRFTTVDGPSPWTPSQRETIHVLQGEVTIEIAGGPTLMLKPGDLASLPAGLETIWHITRHLGSFGYSPDRLLAGYYTARSASWLNAPFLSAPRRGGAGGPG